MTMTTTVSACVPSASVAVTVTGDVPGPAAVPVIVPVDEEIARPYGSVGAFHRTGPTSPFMCARSGVIGLPTTPVPSG